MDEMNCFFIEGIKKLIFRREGDRYICFDPVRLEFYEINEAGACILFLISEEQRYEDIISILCDWFELDSDVIEEYIHDFLFSFPMKQLIVENLIKIGVPSKCIIESETVKTLSY